jgi:hypothetical protein
MPLRWPSCKHNIAYSERYHRNATAGRPRKDRILKMSDHERVVASRSARTALPNHLTGTPHLDQGVT